VRRWLDTWTGIGLIAVGMQRQGWDVQLTTYGNGRWRATFYVTGMAHSIVGGWAWAPTPWRAAQRAAWESVGGPIDVAVISKSDGFKRKHYFEPALSGAHKPATSYDALYQELLRKPIPGEGFVLPKRALDLFRRDDKEPEADPFERWLAALSWMARTQQRPR
jgi:hypothetical protein